MPKRWLVLICVVLVSAIVVGLFLGLREEEPCLICDPRRELAETLHLTDEQVEIVETEKGTLQLTAEQVNIIREPVEQLLDELEPLLDETTWKEIEDILETLVAQGEADLEAIAVIAEELFELEPVAEVEIAAELGSLSKGVSSLDLTQGQAGLETLAVIAQESQELRSAGEVEVVAKLEKVSGEASSSDQTQPLTTGPWQCITVYTPGQETVEGDEDITHTDGWSTKIGFGESDTIVEMNPESGALSAQSKSVGARADRAYALLGINFYVPADNTDVSITTTMRQVATKTVIGPGAAAGVSIPVACGDYSNSAHAWIDYPLGWETGLQIVCAAFAALLPATAPVSFFAKAACVAAKAANYYVQTFDYIKFGQALLNMEGVEEDEITYNAGSLDKGYYRFYIGLNARSCAVVLGLARAVGYAQVRRIEVTMDKPSLTLDITSTDGGYVTEPGEGTFPCCPRDEVDMVASPYAGYQFVEWTGDVATILNVNDPTTTITMNDDCSITANFEEIPPEQFTLTISSIAGGSVTTPGEGTFTRDAGTVVNLVASPYAGYRFTSWTGDTDTILNVNDPTTTITMNSDYSITANFEEEPEYAPMVAAGWHYSVGLKTDGTLVTAGRNDYGQRDVGGWTNIIQVAAGETWTVGLKSDGTAVAVGRNLEGQCDVGHWTNIVQVAAGFEHTVGLKSNGTVVATGDNSDGECNVGGWTGIVQISAYYHTVGLKSDGTVVAVGDNSDGQCNVGGWTNIIQVSAGAGYTLGLRSDGTVVAVGDDWFGETDVGDWTDIIRVTGSFWRTLGLKSDGTVIAVGYNDYGQCDVGGWTDIVQVAADGVYTIGLRSDGTVVAVGSNAYGQCDVGDWDLT